jgi:hypothetical protein
LSLGGFSSLGNSSTEETSQAILVSVEGNTYLSVPILDFGSDRGDEPGIREGRIPGLSTRLPFGDTSPLTRFVIGLDEALRDYRGSEESVSPGNAGRSRDPWNEDLFYRHLPVEPPVLRQENDEPKNGDSPRAILVAPNQLRLVKDLGAHARFGDGRFDQAGAQFSSAANRIVAGLKVMAGLLVTLLLMPPRLGYLAPPAKAREGLLPRNARREGAKRAD